MTACLPKVCQRADTVAGRLHASCNPWLFAYCSCSRPYRRLSRAADAWPHKSHVHPGRHRNVCRLALLVYGLPSSPPSQVRGRWLRPYGGRSKAMTRQPPSPAWTWERGSMTSRLHVARVSQRQPSDGGIAHCCPKPCCLLDLQGHAGSGSTSREQSAMVQGCCWQCSCSVHSQQFSLPAVVTVSRVILSGIRLQIGSWSKHCKDDGRCTGNPCQQLCSISLWRGCHSVRATAALQECQVLPVR